MTQLATKKLSLGPGQRAMDQLAHEAIGQTGTIHHQSYVTYKAQTALVKDLLCAN